MGAKVFGVKDVMARYGIGRTLAERAMDDSGLVLPRMERGPRVVPAAAFIRYMEGKK